MKYPIEAIRCAVRTMEEAQIRELISVLERQGFEINKKNRLGRMRQAVRAALKSSTEDEIDLGSFEIKKPAASKYRQKIKEKGVEVAPAVPREEEDQARQYFHEWVRHQLDAPLHQRAQFVESSVIDGEMYIVVTRAKGLPLLLITEGDRQLTVPLRAVQKGRFHNPHQYYRGNDLHLVRALVQQLHQLYCDGSVIIEVS